MRGLIDDVIVVASSRSKNDR
eukprot:COSAG06_NODE_47356_length_339_cov_2.779167_1_plen_20_part_01